MIELKIDKFEKGKVTFHISRQDLEDYKRLYDKPFALKLSGGFEYILKTCVGPSFYRGTEVKELFVRGDDRSSDYYKIKVSISEYLNIYELVNKYNEEFLDF